MANKVGKVIEPVVEPIAKTVNAINDEFNKLPVGAKVAIGIVGAVVACVTGVGFTTVATTMAKSAIGGAVFGAATYGVESLITGKFDKTELVNNMLDGAADMFMISGVALGAKGVVDCVARNSGRIREAMLANEEGTVGRSGNSSVSNGEEIIEGGSGTNPNALKYNGDGTWTSNEGLIYGQSQDGNRVIHVLKHTTPDPSKPFQRG